MNPLEMVWDLNKVAVKQFTHFYNKLFIVSEASGRCCESNVDGLESAGNSCEATYTLLQLNINAFGSFRKLLRID